MVLVSAILFSSSSFDAIEYKIVEVDRKSVFAGKLGERVHEDIVVEHDGKRYTIVVDGDYHTACTRPWQRLHEGDVVRMPGMIDERTTHVNRMSISKVRH